MRREDALKELNSIMEYNHPHATIRDLSEDIFNKIISELESRSLPISGQDKQNIWLKVMFEKCPVNCDYPAIIDMLRLVNVRGINIDAHGNTKVNLEFAGHQLTKTMGFDNIEIKGKPIK